VGILAYIYKCMGMLLILSPTRDDDHDNNDDGAEGTRRSHRAHDDYVLGPGRTGIDEHHNKYGFLPQQSQSQP
jgi:hypothetical protein